MEIELNSYKSYMEDIYLNIKNSPNIDPKFKSLFKKFLRKMKKLDNDTFKLFMEMNLGYIMDVIDSGESTNPFIQILSSNKNKEDAEFDEEHNDEVEISEMNGRNIPFIDFFGFGVPKQKIKLATINEDEIMSLNGNDIIDIPSKYQNMKWIINSPMELTIASNGTMWMNQSLWEHIIDIIYDECFANAPILVTRPEEPDSITVNLAYDKDQILISLVQNRANRMMKIKFNKHIDSNGNVYATIDDQSAFKIQVATSFLLKGKYLMSPTNAAGTLIGSKIDKLNSISNEFI